MAVIRLMLFACCVLLSSAQEECPVDACESSDVALVPATNNRANDHYYISGMFSVHEEGDDPYTCGDIRPNGLLNSEAFFWAIDTYSKRLGLNNLAFSIGGFVMDSCTKSERAIENVYSFETCRTKYANVSPRNTLAYVGPDSSSEALPTAKLLQDMKRTLVSHAATSPALSDDMFTYFLRTIPNDNVETEVMSKLLADRGIKYVQVIHQDDSYGNGLLEAFKMNADADNICVVSEYTINTYDMDGLMGKLSERPMTKFVVLLAGGTKSRLVLEAVNRNGLDGQFIFLGTSSWGASRDVIQNVENAAENSITIALNTNAYDNRDDVNNFYRDFYEMKPDTLSNSGVNVNDHNPWFNEFWEKTFNCKLADDTCDPAVQSLVGVVERNTFVPYTLMAVEAIINGVKNAAATYCSGDHLCSALLNVEGRGTHLYNGILEAASNSRRFFKDNGDAASDFQRYKVMQVRNNTYVEVYDYNEDASIKFQRISGQQLVILTSACPNDPCLECGELPPTTVEPTTTTTTMRPEENTMDPAEAMKMFIDKYFDYDQEFTGIWRDQSRDDHDWKTRFENDHEWIIALGVLAGLGIVCVLIFEIYILYKLMGTKIGKQWRTMWLGQLLLFALFLCYLTLFAYLFTPSKATCGITRFGVGVCYAMCFAVLLVKLMVVLTSKTTADTLIPGDIDSPNYLRGIYQFLMFIFVVGVQVVIAIQWMIHVPPEAVQVYSNNGDKVWICNHYTWSLNNGWENMTTFVRTEFENHLISLTYVMILILITTVIAMKAHGIITNHRESVFIGIAAGFSIPVWVAWGLVGGLNKDNELAQEFGDACIAFGLLITATIILFAMFLPKVRQLVNMGVEGIYLEDDRDTYYAGSVIMAPPSYKSRPSSVVYVNSNGYNVNDNVLIGDQNTLHLKHPGSTYSAPVYVKRPESTIGSSGKVLRMTGDLTGKHPRESKKAMSELHYGYAGSGYGGTMKGPRSEGGTMRRAHSTQDLGAL